MLIEKYFLLRSKYVINMAILDHSSTFYDAFFFRHWAHRSLAAAMNLVEQYFLSNEVNGHKDWQFTCLDL